MLSRPCASQRPSKSQARAMCPNDSILLQATQWVLCLCSTLFYLCFFTWILQWSHYISTMSQVLSLWSYNQHQHKSQLSNSCLTSRLVEHAPPLRALDESTLNWDNRVFCGLQVGNVPLERYSAEAEPIFLLRKHNAIHSSFQSPCSTTTVSKPRFSQHDIPTGTRRSSKRLGVPGLPLRRQRRQEQHEVALDIAATVQHRAQLQLSAAWHLSPGWVRVRIFSLLYYLLLLSLLSEGYSSPQNLMNT